MITLPEHNMILRQKHGCQPGAVNEGHAAVEGEFGTILPIHSFIHF